MRTDTTWVIPDELEPGWIHPEGDVERKLRDDKRDYHRIYGWLHSKFH